MGLSNIEGFVSPDAMLHQLASVGAVNNVFVEWSPLEASNLIVSGRVNVKYVLRSSLIFFAKS